MTLPQYLADLKERVSKRQEEIPKLIQPERSFVQDTTDLARLIEMVTVASEALKLYAEFAKAENHTFIFDDEQASRAQIYERYSEYSLGDVGVKATEALAELERLANESILFIYYWWRFYRARPALLYAKPHLLCSEMVYNMTPKSLAQAVKEKLSFDLNRAKDKFQSDAMKCCESCYRSSFRQEHLAACGHGAVDERMRTRALDRLWPDVVETLELISASGDADAEAILAKLCIALADEGSGE